MQAMISPCRPWPTDRDFALTASSGVPPAERDPPDNEPAVTFVPRIGLPQASRLPTGGPRKGKDPGSAFGPEAVPSATGLVPVVY